MMEILEMLSGRWLEVAVAAYLIGMMLYGHYRGFIRIAVSVMSLFITLFAVRVAIPQTAAWLEHNTALYETMKESALKASGLDEKMDEMAQTAGLAGKAGERAVIESLEIPDQVKKLLIENNNGEVYQEMGVQIFVSTHDYFVQQEFNMVAAYSELNPKNLDLRFTSLYREGKKHDVNYEMKKTASDLTYNAIMQEFDAMYDREQRIIYGE